MTSTGTQPIASTIAKNRLLGAPTERSLIEQFTDFMDLTEDEDLPGMNCSLFHKFF
jgi:hypothetical protein